METLEVQMRAELKAARDIAAKYDGDIPDEDLALANTHLKAYQDLKAKFEKGKESDAVKASLAAIGFDLGLEVNEKSGVTPETFTGVGRKSLGAMFTDSAEYKALMAQFMGGQINEKARVQSQPMGVKHLIPQGMKALLTGASDTSGGAFVNTDITGILELLGRRPLTIRDLISVRQTESDTVEFVQQTTQMSSAAPVAEATSSAAPTQDGSTGPLVPATGGGYKPEGTIAFQKVTATVKTIAEWVPATKRGLADAAQLRGLIDDELRADLAEEEEDQILNGSGSGENLTGILNTSGIQTQSLATDNLTTIRKAKTKVRTIGRVIPNGIVMNPEDVEALDLSKPASGDGQFYGPGPFANANIPTVWGLPIVESEAIAVKTALVGDFSKAVLWDREQASITATDSHADFFIRNLVAVLGEERVAFGVTRPKAFVKATIAS